MARYALNLPQQLKQEAETWAQQQGVSLNQFILWATAEKVGALKQQLDDPQFPQITYRRGAAGIPMPVIRGTGIRVQAVAIAHEQWQMSAADIAAEYELSVRQVEEALAFYAAHRSEIETHIAYEERLAAEQHD
ncbi:MAG: DUF433 domain-containing protein [Chloroflexi bacterium]|nr:DUF433 domain-containing protein [Chloroflexota bacterium]MBP7042341.1 DUF433 domain-containing protein [Chloroflexota bacterium]